MRIRSAENEVRRFSGQVVATVLVVVAVWLSPACAPGQDDGESDPPVKRLGELIRIKLPITGETIERVRQFGRRTREKAKKEDARLTLIFEFVVLPDQEETARDSELGPAFEIANFISGPKLAGVRTVAYVPQPIQGHAVLPVLACDEIIMAPEASIGKAGVYETAIGQSQRGIYRDIADRRKTIPAAVALWMLEPSQEVLVVDTELSREYVTPNQLEELEKKRPIKSKQKLYDPADPNRSMAAERGELTGKEARLLNFVSYLASNRQDVADALDLPPEAMDEDLSLVADWRPFCVKLTGAINHQTVARAKRLIDDALDQKDANFICLDITSRGGSPAGSLSLSNFLAALDPSRVRTVAFVRGEARSDAALVALACQQAVMQPEAELGGSGAYGLSPGDIRDATEAIRDEKGPWRERSWSLIAAMIDPDLEVYRCTRLDKAGYFCDEELADRNEELQQANVQPLWTKGRQITRPGQPLMVDGNEALQYGLINETVRDAGDFVRRYDLKDFPVLLRPGWADTLIQALGSPALAVPLLIVAFLAMYVELHAPGIGVGGFVAAVCFLLFFWGQFLGGTADWLEAVLFLAGVCFLLLEIFVLPGFGIFGLGGAGLILVSLILATQTFVLPHNAYQLGQLRNSLLTLAGAGAGIVAVGFLLRKWLPQTSVFNRLFLQPPAGEEAESIGRRETLIDLEDFVGRHGTATTQLTPGGKARFGEMLLDVITDGDVVERGTKIEVVEIHGNRVVVKPI